MLNQSLGNVVNHVSEIFERGGGAEILVPEIYDGAVESPVPEVYDWYQDVNRDPGILGCGVADGADPEISERCLDVNQYFVYRFSDCEPD